jgi:MFS family permease
LRAGRYEFLKVSLPCTGQAGVGLLRQPWLSKTDKQNRVVIDMEAQRRAKAFAARVALFYGALFVVYGMHVPYTPVWLNGRGLTSGEISTIMAAPFFLRLLITPGIAMAADRTGRHRIMLIGLAWASLAVVLILSQATGFWPIILLMVPLIVAFTTIMPLTETVAVSGVRHAGLDYGRMRLWGSLTFVAASFAGGFAISHWGSGAGIWLVALGKQKSQRCFCANPLSWLSWWHRAACKPRTRPS